MKNLKRIALLLAVVLSLVFTLTACLRNNDNLSSSGGGTSVSADIGNSSTGGVTSSTGGGNSSMGGDSSSAGGEVEPDPDPDAPAYEVKNYTLFVNKIGTCRFEAEDVDVTYHKISSDNPSKIVERKDASGGKFLAAATGNVQSGQYFEFKINLRFNAKITMTAAYAQTDKWKGYDEDLTKAYTYIIDDNRNMPLSAAKTVLKARQNITEWETFAYQSVTLPLGEHRFRVTVAENTGKGNPNIDYFDFAVEKVSSVPDENEDVPANDAHTALQYAYLNDSNYENIEAYAVGVNELSRPRAITLDFSKDSVNSSTYVLQYAYDNSFADATLITNLSEKKASVFNLKTGRKVYFRGAADEKGLSSATVHEIELAGKGPRNLYISGVSNVRDIGGYTSSLVPGGRIRQGLYYRGANLNSITEAGKAEMLRLGIKCEIDLRDDYQCKGPYVDGIAYNAISIPSGTEGRRFEEFADEYKKIFTLIANADKNPVYLHCTAGADRTGISSFMLLTVCGAEYEDMARDYLFTNFSTHGSRFNNYTWEFKNWWKKLDNFSGDTKAEKAKNWLISKGVTAEQVETIREIFVEGYKKA